METVKRWYSNFLQCVRLETIESDDRLAENLKAEILLPSEIMEDILSRLPVKSILRFRTVSKPWLSLFSTPSFTQLQLTRAHTAFFITAVDVSTRKRYFLSAPHDGGSVTHLMTLKHIHRPGSDIVTDAQHLNGLVSSISEYGYYHGTEAFVVNPTTREVFKLPYPPSRTDPVHYFFGFDESTNEHKILCILGVVACYPQIMIFSMSNYSWRKIDATLSIMDGWFNISTKSSVCVNSIVYLLITMYRSKWKSGIEILAFDLRTETFSIVKVPLDCVLRVTRYPMRDDFKFVPIYPYFIKINGCMGIVCYDQVVDSNEMHIWILQDYENRVWVRETVTFPASWSALGCPFPIDYVNVDEIIFSLSKLSRNVISAPIYNIKSGCFRSVEFTLNRPSLCSERVKFNQIKCYVESIVRLPRNKTKQ